MIILLGFMLVMTLLSSAAWVVNIYIAVKEIYDPEFAKTWITSEHGLLAYVITVDFSTVTTFVFMLTAACLTWGVWRLYRAKKRNSWTVVKNKRNFPFWRGYKIVYTQFGLLGTLWGFIIALKQTTAATPESLLGALGTSLWSSFSAIGLAFIICPLIEKGVQRLIPPDEIGQDGVVLDDINSITQAFNHLFKQITNVTAALEQFEKITELFEVVQNALRQLDSLQNKLGTLEVSVGERLKENEELKRRVSQLSTNNEDLERKVSQLSVNVDNLTGQIHKERKHLSDLLEFIQKSLLEDDDLSP